MFKPREQIECGAGGPAVTAAALSHAQLLAPPAHPSSPSLRTRLASRIHQAESYVVHDLAEDIGSARWFRGLGAMLGLGIAALSFWPDFSALEAAPAMQVGHAERDEFRSQMIMPLGTGGESGRRMGANGAIVVPLAAAPERTSIHMVATLAEGDSFARMLQRAGVGAYDAARTAELVGAVVPLSEIAPGTRFEIVLGKRAAPGQPRLLDKIDFQARFDTALTISRAEDGLTIGKRAIPVDTTPLRIRGTVGQSLYRSARAAGAGPEAIQQFLQAVDQHLSLEEIVPGDQFDIIVAYRRSAEGQSEMGKLLFAGIEQDGKPRVQLVRGKDGRLQDALGGGARPDWTASVTSEGLLAPVSGRVTSHYGLRRHPILGYARMHAGIDFGAAWGSPIFAVTSGVVSYAGRRGGHGNYVRLEHGGFGTGYAHMSRIAVTPGTKVQAGQVIGYVGSTGLSTGPHLHYEVYQGGRTVNPANFRFTGTPQAASRPLDTQALKAAVARLKSIKPGGALGRFNPAGAARSGDPAGQAH